MLSRQETDRLAHAYGVLAQLESPPENLSAEEWSVVLTIIRKALAQHRQWYAAMALDGLQSAADGRNGSAGGGAPETATGRPARSVGR